MDMYAARVRRQARPPDVNQLPVVRLVLADRYPMLLDGMAHALRAERGFDVLACCASARDLLRAISTLHPDVVLLDRDLLGDSMDLLNRIRSERPSAHAIVVSAGFRDEDMLRAMRLGARGFLLKSAARQLLVQCVRKVCAGAIWLEKNAMLRTMEQLLHWDAAARHATAILTPRELQVVRLTAGRHSTAEIARALSVSVGTLKVHLHHIYRKLGLKGRLDLTLYARDRGLV